MRDHIIRTRLVTAKGDGQWTILNPNLPAAEQKTEYNRLLNSNPDGMEINLCKLSVVRRVRFAAKPKPTTPPHEPEIFEAKKKIRP